MKSKHLALIALLFLTSPVQALQINPTFVNGLGYTWDSTRQGVINQAIADWELSILDNQTVDVRVEFTHAGTGGYLGQWSGGILVFAGTDIYPWTDGVDHTIFFNVDLFSGSNYLWWDPTPTTSNDLPFAAWDALSVARHEMGHMMGFTSGFYRDDIFASGDYDRWNGQIVGSTFDPDGLNVSMASAGNLGHVADSGITQGDLMVTAVTNGVRRPISQIDLDMLALAHGYLIPEATLAGDFDADGDVDGVDFGLWQSGYPTASGANLGDGDADGDGDVDGVDFGLWQENYPTNLGGAAMATVPEPATLFVMLAPGLVILLRNRRSRFAAIAKG